MDRAAAGAERRLGIVENWPQFSLLILINACVGGMVGLERTVVPLVATEEFHLTSDTLIFSFIVAFGLVKALANVLSGKLADRFTRKSMLVAGWLIGVPVPFMLAWGPSWNWILAANVLLGASQGFTWSMTVAMKNDLVGTGQRGLAMGLNEFAGYGGLGATALLTGYVAARTGLRPEPFYIGFVYVALGLGLSIAAVRDTTAFVRHVIPSPAVNTASAPTSEQTSDRQHAKRTMFGVCQAGLVNNLNDGLSWGVLPLLFTAHGLGVEAVGLIKAVYPLTWSLAQLGTGALADRAGRRPLIAWGMAAQAVGLAVIGAGIPSAYASGLAGAVVLGVGTAMVYPALLATAADIAPPAQRATTLGWYRFWRDLGYPAGALLAGMVSAAFGLASAVYVAALLTFVSGLVAHVSIASRFSRRHAMRDITTRTRERIEAQGFVGLDDRTLMRINYWLRLAPAICMAWTAIGTFLGSAPTLWALVPFAALGAALHGHPFDVIYSYGFRRWTAGPPLPRYPLPRRLACLLATVMLMAAAVSFQTGHVIAGNVLGWFLGAAAFINVATGFCIPSFVYGLMFGRPSGCVTVPTRRATS
jgi:MFS family permease